MARKTRKCKRCPAMVYPEGITGLCANCLNEERRRSTPSELIAADREKQRVAFELSTVKKKYDEALKTIKRQERELHVVNELAAMGAEPFRIEPHEGSGTSEAAVVLVASDWHVEENVDPARVSYLNEFNIDIAKSRAETFFRAGLRLTNLLAQDIKIHTVVLALLGDFISNDIHEEFPELNELQPTHAIVMAQNLLISGIEYLLENSAYNLVVPCHSGNHARTTRTTRFGAENGHSLEYLMYLHLAAYFRNNDRVQFRIAEGYHSYLDVYGKTLRFHHGHAVNYQGGVGGLFIPAFKAISQWDKARQADLDIFGHFHQSKDGGKFVCNGSLVGYNSFALSIKADYEPPKQTLLLLDKKRGRTCTWPILFSAEGSRAKASWLKAA
jgi:hypothetical protein